MTDVIDQSKWGGVCGFVSVLHGLRSRSGITSLGKTMSTGDLEASLGAEMITYLKMTQIERPQLAEDIITYTRTWGGGYAAITMDSMIQDIKTTVLSKSKTGDWDGRGALGCALPPTAVEDYLRHAGMQCKRVLDGSQLSFSHSVMRGYKDCVVGVGATSQANNGWHGLRHWVYVTKAGVMMNWAEETPLRDSADPPYDATRLAVLHNCIVYAIQIL
jgi:hypothetical protein